MCDASGHLLSIVAFAPDSGVSAHRMFHGSGRRGDRIRRLARAVGPDRIPILNVNVQFVYLLLPILDGDDIFQYTWIERWQAPRRNPEVP